MFIIFLTVLTNEIIGLLPITLIQINYISIYFNSNLYQNIQIQFILALAFALGNIVMYLLGKYGSIPFLKIFKKIRIRKETEISETQIKTNFYWIILMRSIPFFPAKSVSLGLGILRYNIYLFFISSLIGIFIRGIILIFIYKVIFKMVL